MKRKIRMMITSLILCVAVTAVTVGGTPVSQNDIGQNETAQEEIVTTEEPVLAEEPDEVADHLLSEAEVRAFLTDEVYVREMNAVNSLKGKNADITTEVYAKRYLFLGDSTSCDGSYITYLAQSVPSYINCKAVGGATYSNVGPSNVLKQMEGENLSAYDAVFMNFGINDFVWALTVGDATTVNDKRTLYGALTAAVTKCRNAGVKCYVIIPFPIEHQFSGTPNGMQSTYGEYLAAIKKVCRLNNVETIDFNTAFGVNANNFWEYYADKIHPNSALHMKAANYLRSFLGEDYNSGLAIGEFVERLYAYCLSRSSDPTGYNHWVNLLQSKKITGTKAAEGFFFSTEFINRSYSDETYVDLLYYTMLDRAPDQAGKDYWVGSLKSGVSRRGIFYGFANSKEFKELCQNYGIISGTGSSDEPRDKNPQLTAFVARLYTKALGRSYDIDGLNYWCEALLSGKKNITEVSTTGFFHSQEFMNKHLNDKQYVTVLYRTFLDREPEPAGLEYWLNELNKGRSRDDIINGFVYSKEFGEIKKAYGL